MFFNTDFDGIGAKAGDYYPEALRTEIDGLNARIYATVNSATLPPCRGERATLVDGGHRVADRQCSQAAALAKEQGVVADHEGSGSEPGQGREIRLKLAFATGAEDMYDRNCARLPRRLSTGHRQASDWSG
jgi:hypothetical protein